MLLVKLTDRFMQIPEIPCWFPATLYVTVTHSVHEIMGLPVVSFGLEDPVDFPSFRVLDTRCQQVTWWLADGTSAKCILVSGRLQQSPIECGVYTKKH